MSSLVYQILTSTSLLTLGLYHLISTTRLFLKSPSSSYISKPFHSLPLTSPSPSRLLRHLPHYLTISALTISLLHSLLLSSSPDPLLKGHSPVHLFTSLQSSSLSFLFLLLLLFLLLSDSSSSFSLLPPDLFFALFSVAFFLHFSLLSSRAGFQTSHLQSKCDIVSARISAASSAFCFLLAVVPRLFAADVALAGSVCLQGLWQLQTGLSLYVEAFIPEGCHRLLDVVSGVEGSTKCELDESRLRAVAILDLAFVLHLIVVVVMVFVVYGVVAKAVGVSRRLGVYEALPNQVDNNHVQLKTLSGTQA